MGARVADNVGRPPWLAQVLGGDGEPVGAGFLVNDGYLLTCAHVVLAALGRHEDEGLSSDAPEVRVRFPACPGPAALKGALVPGGWIPVAEDGRGDLAVLRLVPPEGTSPAPLTCQPRLVDHPFRTFGFPRGHPDGVVATGVIRGATGPGLEWWQLEDVKSAGYRVQRGFSGGPVWDDRAAGVVGMVVAEDAREPLAKAAAMIPLPVLAGMWPPLAGLLPSALQADLSAWLGHWEPRSRGVDLIADEHTWYFTGRESARRALVEWLRTPPAQGGRGLVVTGAPGSGKSALLARLVTVSDPVFRRRVPDLDPELDPRVGAVDVAVHARRKTLQEVVQAIAEPLGLAAREPDDLVQGIVAGRRPLAVVVDAVDEAADPEALARWLRELAKQGRGHEVWVLVGARPWLLETLGQAGFDALDLDQQPYLSPDDVQRYVQRILLGEPGSVYPEVPDLARAVSEAVAHRAGPSFLVALLAARSLLHRRDVVDVRVAGWQERFPADVAEAMDDYLAVFREDRHRVRDLLRPLAYAEGDGLPHTRLWAAMANALACCTSYALDDVTWLRRTPAAAYLIETRRPDHDAPAVYRLFHQALVEYLRPPEVEREQQECITRTLLALVTADGRPDWRKAPPYLTRHLASHAAAARSLVALLDDGQLDDEGVAAVKAFSLFVALQQLGPPRTGRAALVYRDLQVRFGRMGNQADLDDCVDYARQTLAVAPVDHPDRARSLSVLAVALRIRFERVGHLDDLDKAIETGWQAVEATSADHPDRARCLSDLAVALRIRFRRIGQLADLDEAVAVGRQAVEATPVDNPDRAAMLQNLGNALRTRFDRIGQQVDLDAATEVCRSAVAATPVEDPERTERLSNLAITLATRFERIGRLADLDEAVAAGREAVAATPNGHPNWARYLSNLGLTLRTRFDRTGQEADLDDAVTLLRQAVDATPADHPDRAGYLSSFGKALWTRFDRTGQEADLDDAVTLLRQAVVATPADHPDRARYLSNLGLTLRTRFDRTGQEADLDDAVTLLRQAVDATPADHPDRAGYLSNLGNALRTRGDRSKQPADLDEAVGVGRAAVAATPPDHPSWPGRLSSVGSALLTRFERIGRLADLEEAVAVGRAAVDATPDDHPDRARYLSSLGVALQARFNRSGWQPDLDQAVALCREGARSLTASLGHRLAAARQWGRLAEMVGDWSSAAQGYSVAVELLPLVAWHGLDQATRQHHLREWAGLAGEAATAAVLAGSPARAVELLEAGRGTLWTQALRLRQDLVELRERHPDLAARLDKARAVLDPTRASVALTAAPSIAGGLSGDERAAEQRLLEERRRAAQDWDAAVERVRQLDGFQDFLRPAPFARLRRAAVDGPVVIVNISRLGSHALIISPGDGPGPDNGVQVVDLPAATWDTVIDMANTLRTAQDHATNPILDWKQRENDRHAVFDVLAWTWHAITEPVLTALGHTATPPGPLQQWPRIWWCPTGPATVLLLHAAGIHPRTTISYPRMGEAAAIVDSVPGRVVSSYTPTLTALTRSRTRPAPEPPRVLAVGVPDAPGGTPLPAVLPELQALDDALPAATHRTFLVGAAATREAVIRAIPEHTWLHLSCHAAQHPTDPFRSAFLLDEAPLTLADLASLDLPNADLAYLAACQTATGDAGLLDEALHLAAALQMVGFRHVLAAHWGISDAAAPALAETVYAHLVHPDPEHRNPSDRPDSARAAHALHHAVTQLRQATPAEPLLWAPYIHLGP